MNSLEVLPLASLGPLVLHRRCSAASLGVAALLAVTSARAQTAAERETARHLMDRGDEQSDRGDLTAALASYRAAHAIMHVPTTGIEVAKTLARLGSLVEARDVAIEVLRITASPDDPRPFQVAREEAMQLARELRELIPVLTVEVQPREAVPAARLSIDDRRVPVAALGQPYFLNPGAHRLVVSAPGHRPVELTVSLAARERRSLQVTLEPLPPDPRSAPRREEPAIASASLTRPQANRARSVRGGHEPRLAWPVWIGLGVTATGVVIGAVSGAVSLDRAGDAKVYCEGNLCSPEARTDRDAALSAAKVSNVGWALAGVGAAFSVTAWWLSKPSASQAGASLTVSAGISGGALGVSGAFF